MTTRARIKPLLLAAAAAIGILQSSPGPAWGHATELLSPMCRLLAADGTCRVPWHVPASVVVTFDASDGDWNIVLLPRDPAQEPERFQEFFRAFWRFNGTHPVDRADWPLWRDFVEERLHRKGPVAVPPRTWAENALGSDYPACRQWVGQPAPCKVFDPRDESCKRFLANGDCLRGLSTVMVYSDLWFGALDDASTLTASAEVELPGDISTLVSTSPTARRLLHIGNCADSGRLCGRKVWVSGVAAYDQGHAFKPELHPLQSLVIEEGASEGGVRASHRYHIAAFLDGSETDFYRKQDRSTYPSNVVIDLPFFRSLVKSPPQGVKAQSFCRIKPHPGIDTNVASVKPQADWKKPVALDGACAPIEVTFHRASEGGFWGAEVEMGWEGVRWDVTERDPAETTPPAGYKGPPRRFYQFDYAVELKHPAEWKDVVVKAVAADGRSDVVIDVGNPVFPTASDKTLTWRVQKVSVKVPVAADPNRDLYSAAIDLIATRAAGPELLRDRRQIHAPRPALAVRFAPPPSSPGAVGPYRTVTADGTLAYKATARATASGFLAPPPAEISWLRGNPPVATKGDSVELPPIGSGEVVALTAAATDSKGIELATWSQAISTPLLKVGLETTAGTQIAGTPKDYRAPTGLKGDPFPGELPPAVAAWRKYKEMKVVAQPAEDRNDSPFPVIPLDGRKITLEWKVSRSAGGAGGWTDATCASLGQTRFPNDTCTLVFPEGDGRFDYDVAVTATDEWKRTARTYQRVTNGYVIFNASLANLLQKIVSTTKPSPGGPPVDPFGFPGYGASDPLPILLPSLQQSLTDPPAGDPSIATAWRRTLALEGVIQASATAWGRRTGKEIALPPISPLAQPPATSAPKRPIVVPLGAQTPARPGMNPNAIPIDSSMRRSLREEVFRQIALPRRGPEWGPPLP